jgi:poly(3-hydroxybutyrate) depolymerase
VFLAGDACHLHPPFGGYGMNMGVADGVDLGWKMAAVLQGWGGPELLDSYEQERKPVHHMVLDEAVANHAMLGNQLWKEGLDGDNAEGASMRREVGAVIQAGNLREFTTLGVMLGYRYENSPVIVADGTRAPGHDYINYVQEFIRHVQSIYGNCHVVSVCQPTVPVLAAISLMASRGEKTPLTMTMMGGPIDARKSPTAVNNLATTKGFDWFENNVIYRVPGNFPGAGRRVYPGFLQHTGFVAMNPDRHATSHYDYFKDLIKGDDASIEAHRKFYDEYNAVLDMDADYYLETIRTVFQDFNLVYGTWNVKGVDGRTELVRPQDITTTAMLTVEGELDDISGSGQTAAAHGLCTGIAEKNRQHLEVPGAGHYGIFSGRRWRDVVYPEVRKFILNHAASKATPKAVVAAPTVKAVAKTVALKKAKPAAAPAKVAVQAVPQATVKPVVKKAVTKVSAKTPAKTASKATAKTSSVKTAWVEAPKPKAKA